MGIFRFLKVEMSQHRDTQHRDLEYSYIGNIKVQSTRIGNITSRYSDISVKFEIRTRSFTLQVIDANGKFFSPSDTLISFSLARAAVI